MLELRQLKLPVDHKDEDLEKVIEKCLSSKKLRIMPGDFSFLILKRSLDCRRKPELFYIYSVCVTLNNKLKEADILSENGKRKGRDRMDLSLYEPVIYKLPIVLEALKNDMDDLRIPRPVVIGSGPAGLFAAYILSLSGLKPIIFERGEEVTKRRRTVDEFLKNGTLNTNSNVQFGEGGAGTFSDGKLNTLTKDKYGRQGFVFDTFIKCGADEKIKYDYKPHIGTDILTTVVKNLRDEIKALGGEFHFETLIDGIDIEDNRITGVRARSTNAYKTDDKGSKIDVISAPAGHVILATGHSARDTFMMLKDKGVKMEPKSFAVGFRVQHPQDMINISQYGKDYPKSLGASPYKVTNTASNGRRVYSFCMCPGGYVINSSSEDGRLCVNGMSYSGRDSAFSNSAIIVNVEPDDFIKACPDRSDDELCGMYYQRLIEEKAYNLGKGKIPAERFTDFENNKEPSDFDQSNAKGGVSKADLHGILSKDMEEAFIESMHRFGHMIDGFDSKEAIMYAIEGRTSSPVKIPRDEDFTSNIKGLYPCGEGAGYAGGITSAAVDGIKVAEAVINDLNKNYKII